MACLHKFAVNLNLEQLTFEPTTLIVGTFNPGWDNLGNYASWFYGRTNNNYFWDVLPRLYENNSLRQATHSDWKAFCHRHKIALTDLIYSIDDADSGNPQHVQQLKNYRDDAIVKYFRQFTLVDIPKLLAIHTAIEHVYLTRSINDLFWRQRWRPVADYSQVHEIKTKTLLTPSGGARFQIPKGVKISLGDFIFAQWRNSWYSL